MKELTANIDGLGLEFGAWFEIGFGACGYVLGFGVRVVHFLGYLFRAWDVAFRVSENKIQGTRMS